MLNLIINEVDSKNFILHLKIHPAAYINSKN